MDAFEHVDDFALRQRSLAHPEAFGDFYGRHLPFVLRYLLAKTGDRELAADLAGETFARALAARRVFEPRARTALPWLYGIAHHLVAGSARREHVDDRARRALEIGPIEPGDDAFDALRAALVSATARDNAAHARSGRPSPYGGPRRGSRAVRSVAWLALGAGALVLAAWAVPGAFISPPEPNHVARLNARQVVAHGSLQGLGPWQLLVSHTGRGWCLGLRVAEMPGGPPTLGEGCGGAAPGSLSVASLSGGAVGRHALVYGMAPDAAQRVSVGPRGSPEVVVGAVDDHRGVPGRFYLAELPADAALGGTTVRALGVDGAIVRTAGVPPAG